MPQDAPSVTFIGFGEAATAIASGWLANIAIDCAAFDIKTDNADPAISTAKKDEYRAAGVTGHDTLPAALNPGTTVFSTVTPDQALIAATAAAQHLPLGALYLDCNSCSPGTKRRAASVIEAAGGRYVDVAVMAPVHPALHRTPLLVSGPRADAALDTLARLDMSAKLADGPVGYASSIKMIRSIMVKGLEALMVECVLAGRRAGVDEAVFDSLTKTIPGFDWPERAAYMLERVTTHGTRRAAEMREVATTLRELKLDGRMADATADWQSTIGDLMLDTNSSNYRIRADAILSALDPPHNQRALP
ncbi:MAG: DUF1932 domain-containing protein [Pseudomonadota bacterium]